MLVVIPFCNKDCNGAVNLLHWMRELDGQHVLHKCVIVAPNGMDTALIQTVLQAARCAFSNVQAIQTTRLEERPWPVAPNSMFRCFLRWVSKSEHKYFLWNEPDCIHLKPKSLDLYEEEYIKSGMPFMGSIVHKPMVHLTGCAVYPSDAANYNPALEIGPENIAFDCIDPERTLKHTHHTELFHHQWFDFGQGAGIPTFPTQAQVALISPQAVLFHRNKDHTLIDRLREAPQTPREAGYRHNLLAKRTQNATNIVHTYFEEMGRPKELEILQLWEQSWKKHGWYPVVMNAQEIVHVPGWKKCVRDFEALPTINTPAYELACYKRWLAIASRGGGLMVDYDVMNYGWTPDMAEDQKRPDALTFFEERVPSVVIGEKPWYKMAIDYMRNYQPLPDDKINGQPHTSDMCILQRVWGTPWIKYQPVVVQYRNPGWEKALLVHYCNSQTNGNKVEAIKLR